LSNIDSNKFIKLIFRIFFSRCLGKGAQNCTLHQVNRLAAVRRCGMRAPSITRHPFHSCRKQRPYKTKLHSPFLLVHPESLPPCLLQTEF
jgi:hypothetical protein